MEYHEPYFTLEPVLSTKDQWYVYDVESIDQRVIFQGDEEAAKSVCFILNKLADLTAVSGLN